MLSIPMGGVDVVLGVQWLQSLGTIAFNFEELFIKFSMEGKEVELRGITGIAWYYGTFQSNLLFLHLQPSLHTLVLDIRSNSIILLPYNE